MRRGSILAVALASVPFILVIAFLWSSWVRFQAREEAWLAAERGEVDRLREEIARQHFAVTENDYRGQTLLHVACNYGQAEVVRLLLNSDADPNALDKYRRTPLMEAVNAEASPERVLLCIDLLLKERAEIDLQDEEGRNALSIAIGTHRPKLVARLLDAGATLNRQLFLDEWTPLHWACAQEESNNGSLETVRLLLDGGADLEAKDKRGRTPLDVARSRKNPLMEKLLLNMEKVRQRNKIGKIGKEKQQGQQKK